VRSLISSKVVDLELDAGLAREREQVQHSVRRAAARGDRGDRVLEPFAGDHRAGQLARGAGRRRRAP
jgi:hypothetical protein